VYRETTSTAIPAKDVAPDSSLKLAASILKKAFIVVVMVNTIKKNIL
jgi:hypothetical protein